MIGMGILMKDYMLACKWDPSKNQPFHGTSPGLADSLDTNHPVASRQFWISHGNDIENLTRHGTQAFYNMPPSRTQVLFQYDIEDGFLHKIYDVHRRQPGVPVKSILLLRQFFSLWPPCHEGSSSVCLRRGVQPALG